MKISSSTLIIGLSLYSLTSHYLGAHEFGPGIAAEYPGDQGLAQDRRVVVYENFEQARQIADFKKKPWTSISNKADALSLSEMVPSHSKGKQSLLITAKRGKNSGGHLYVNLGKNGHDKLHARYYVRFAKDAGYMHHFTYLRAVGDPKPWPMGAAGIRPKGDQRFSTGFEPNANNKTLSPPGFWNFYTYWHQMRSYQNNDGSGDKCYGNIFAELKPTQIPRGEWMCIEFMIKANSKPDTYDGELAFWMDGELKAHWKEGGYKGAWLRDNFRPGRTPNKAFEGFNFRSTDALKLNAFCLENYVSEGVFKRTEKDQKANPALGMNTQELKVWFDDVVVATEYIGPIANKNK